MRIVAVIRLAAATIVMRTATTTRADHRSLGVGRHPQKSIRPGWPESPPDLMAELYGLHAGVVKGPPSQKTVQ